MFLFVAVGCWLIKTFKSDKIGDNIRAVFFTGAFAISYDVKNDLQIVVYRLYNTIQLNMYSSDVKQMIS